VSRPERLDPPEGYRWVTCSVKDDWDTGRYRHLVRIGGLDTKCGASASHPEIWRANSTKPYCPKCRTFAAPRPTPRKPLPSLPLIARKAPAWSTV
jgi:hypothetical protein